MHLITDNTCLELIPEYYKKENRYGKKKQSNLYLMVTTITPQLKPLPTAHWHSFLSKQTGCIFTDEHMDTEDPVCGIKPKEDKH